MGLPVILSYLLQTVSKRGGRPVEEGILNQKLVFVGDFPREFGIVLGEGGDGDLQLF